MPFIASSPAMRQRDVTLDLSRCARIESDRSWNAAVSQVYNSRREIFIRAITLMLLIADSEPLMDQGKMYKAASVREPWEANLSKCRGPLGTFKSMISNYLS